VTPAEALKTADLHAQIFCRAVASKIREVLPESSRIRARLTVTIEGRKVQVDPHLRTYREDHKDEHGVLK
jgi:hypothetical protein